MVVRKAKKTAKYHPCKFRGLLHGKATAGASVPRARTLDGLSSYFTCGDSISPGTRLVIESSASTPCDIQDLYRVQGGFGKKGKWGKKFIQTIDEITTEMPYDSQVVSEYLNLVRHPPHGQTPSHHYFSSESCSTVSVHPSALIHHAQSAAFLKAGFKRNNKSGGLYKPMETLDY